MITNRISTCRRVARVIALIALVSTTTIGGLNAFGSAKSSSAAVASGVFEVPVNQFNMCGNGCGYYQQTSDLVHFFVAAASTRPWLVTINEVCSPQYAQVRDQLSALGYTPDRYISVHVGGSCNFYGTAMFTRGGNSTNAVIHALTPYNGEPRSIMCRVKTTYAGTFPMCVTHLITSTQRDQAYSFFYYNYSTGVRLIGGEFNKTPSNMGSWYNTEYAMDTTNKSTYSTFTPSPSMKIDYAFNHLISIRGGDTYCYTSPYTDHCYLHGTFYF